MAQGRFQTIPSTTEMSDLQKHNDNWTKADTELTRIEEKEDASVSNLQSQITAEQQARITADTNHANSTTAHPASHITFDKGTSGMSSNDANAGIIEAWTRAGNIIASSGTSNSEDVDARTLETGYTPNRTITLFGDVLRDMQSRLKAAAIATAALKHGWNYLLTNDASPLSPTISGRTLVNILGSNVCETLTGWTTGGTVATSTTQVKNGTNSIKCTASASQSYAYKDYTFSLDTTKQYIVGGWVYIESYTSGSLIINMHDSGGFVNLRYSASADTSKVGTWQFIYAKIPTSNTFVGSGFRLSFGQGSTPNTSVAYFDAIRLYELDTTTYNAIGSTYTASTTPSIDDILPYCDSVQSVRGPMLTKSGKNLIPPFTEWTLHANATVTAPYSLTLNATAGGQTSYVNINTVPNTTYTLSLKTNTGKFYVDGHDASGAYIATLVSSTSTQGVLTATFTTQANCAYVQIGLTNTASGTFTFDSPQLELGTAATSFEAANPDYIYGITDASGNPLKLASSVDGSVKDSLFYRDGAWRKEKRWVTDVSLDSSLSWAFSGDNIGYKRVYAPVSGATGQTILRNSRIVKYNGAIIPNLDPTAAADRFDVDSSSDFILSLSDTDTGFDNAYIPAANEIQSYFNGWKVNGYTAGTTATNEASGSVAASGTYTLAHAGKYKSVTVQKSSDNVTFTAAVEGTDYTANWNATNAVLTNPTGAALYYQITYTYGVTPNSWASVVDGSSPSTNTLAYVSANKAANYTPYKLNYQLATTVEETVTVEGSIDTNAGGNQIDVEEGVIVREVVTPAKRNDNSYYIFNVKNDPNYSDCPLKNRVEKIIKIYKNGQPDNLWIIGNGGTANGKQYAYITAANFDTTAVYTVTYTIYSNDKGGFTANVVDVSADYNSNQKTILDNVNKKLADDETNITVLQTGKANKNQSPWLAPTMTNAWVNYGGTDAAAGYMRDDFGFTELKGRIKSGTVGSAAFTLPSGYRPKETQRFTVSSNGAFGELVINTDGTVVPTVGSNVSFNVQVRFRAEQ